MARGRQRWDEDWEDGHASGDSWTGRRSSKKRREPDRQRRGAGQRRPGHRDTAGTTRFQPAPSRDAGAAPAAERSLLPAARDPAVATCGGCRHWTDRGVPDGRGTCTHPGSGFSFPYLDTPACPFFEASRSGGMYLRR